MLIELNDQQKALREKYQQFTDEFLHPYANQYDQEQYLPKTLIKRFASPDYLGALVSQEYGGQGIDYITFGLLSEEISKGCSSLCGLLTVQSMVISGIQRWGTEEQKKAWLPGLANGNILASFALSEPDAGSDIKQIKTTATQAGNTYILNGTKKWITCGQMADLLLVFAYCNKKSCTFLVDSKSAGVTVKPIRNMLGMRAAMIAEITFNNCHVPRQNLLGTPGSGFSHVVSSTLDIGRYCVAWGSTGISQACLEACLSYTKKREQFGTPLKNHQLIKHFITDMLVSTTTSRNLCYQAGYLKEKQDPSSILTTLMAKYYASRCAYQNASHAVQIHGANGCSDNYSVQRHLRNAKVMEIIEGSSEIMQNLIADYGYHYFK